MIERSDIISEVEKELDYGLNDASERLSESARNEIRDDSITDMKRVLNSLTKQELQSESALKRFVNTTLAYAQMRMHRQ